MTEFSNLQKEYLDSWFKKISITFNDKVSEVSQKLQTEISKLKEDLNKVVAINEEKIKTLENENKQLKEKINTLERRTRKNNIVIFGVQSNQKDTWEEVLDLFNSKVQVEVTRNEVNDIYYLGKGENPPLLVEFVSYQTKLQILKNAKKLKGCNISIAQDLCLEDRLSHKILVKHMLEAKGKGLQAYIKGHKLVVGKDSYNADQLEYTTFAETTEKEQPKSDSAPATPNPQRRQEKLLKELMVEEKQHQDTKKPKCKASKLKSGAVVTRSNSITNNHE